MNQIAKDFPHTGGSIREASFFQLVRQGLWLHYASFVGPLRASKEFRKSNSDWLKLVAVRWWKEYGLNIMLFITFQALILLYARTATDFIALEFVALLLLPTLTVLQMIIDSFRTDVHVYYDPESRTGLTVRKYITKDGQTTWAYYNHYALPVGHRVGKNIRKSLHEQARSRKMRLVCHAQSETVADYYERENHQVKAVRFDESKPFLLWNYSDSSTSEYEDLIPQKEVSLVHRIFGVNNIRNSGSSPLLFA